MDKMKLSWKLWGIVAATMLVVAMTAGLSLDRLYDHLLDGRKAKVQNLVESAHSVMSAYAAKAESGELTEADAKKQALIAVESMRYDGGNYFWINDTHPTMIMHPIKPALNGKDLSSFQDPKKNFLFKDMVSAVKSGGAGFVDYYWAKPANKDLPIAKVSYVKHLANWDWIVGSGIYLDDVDVVYRAEVLRFAAIITVLLLAVAGLMIWVMRGINRSLSTASETATSIAAGNLNNEISRTHSGDAVDNLLGALDSMQESLRTQIESEKKIATEAGRIKQALDNVATNVIVTDSADKIIFSNKSMTRMLSEIQNDIQSVNSGFSLNTLIGMPLQALGTSPVSSTDSIHPDEVKLGSRTFRQVISPVVDEKGHQIGSVSEFIDRTQQIAVEKEVQNIVNAAKNGDLDHLIQLEGKNGIFLRLSESINQLVEINRSIIKDTIDVVSAMEHGDLTKRITKDYDGAYGELKRYINRTSSRLTEIINGIQNASDNVASGSGRITQGNQSLSQRTAEQSSSLEHTAASMEEINGAVKNNAINAEEANRLAAEMRDQAETSGQVVVQAIDAMEQINSSSSKMSEIIGVINEIAFQTNLLALNAAVEAAHAGDQGKGFAVVASEVRNLAQRSGEAAKEIATLIEDSAHKVSTGRKLVNNTGQSLDEIVVMVNRVSSVIAEIATANNEQSIGIDQVNMAMVRIEKGTQENAKMVDDISKSSTSLDGEASELAGLVDFFKLSDNHDHSANHMRLAG